MAASSFPFISSMESEETVSTLHQNGQSYLAVTPAYLKKQGWTNQISDTHNHGLLKNWYLYMSPGCSTDKNDASALPNYFFHIHLICKPWAESVFTSNLLLLDAIKLKAGPELGWWGVRDQDGRFSFFLQKILADESFRLGMAKALACFIPHAWRSSNFLPSSDQARMCDLHTGAPEDMEMELPKAL